MTQDVHRVVHVSIFVHAGGHCILEHGCTRCVCVRVQVCLWTRVFSRLVVILLAYAA